MVSSHHIAHVPLLPLIRVSSKGLPYFEQLDRLQTVYETNFLVIQYVIVMHQVLVTKVQFGFTRIATNITSIVPNEKTRLTVICFCSTRRVPISNVSFDVAFTAVRKVAVCVTFYSSFVAC